ncbi:MAG: R3H domain-containing nucleic acid-binding protein [Candidatus Bipolaricaulaceae bacterium]
MDPQVREALLRFFQGLLAVLKEEGRVEVLPKEGEVYVNLQGNFKALPQDDPAFREALARLAALHLKTALRAAVAVDLDFNGQEEARRRQLVARALALAERVKAEGRPIELEPMPPKDRRLIHLALAEVPGVRTHSVGRDENRRVVIEPAEPSAP